MKPTKNRYFCIGCGRTKMLFNEERNALNFIRFNAENIKEETGVAPIRAYYCKACGGWHVTHKPISYRSQKVQTLLKQYCFETEQKIAS